MINIVHKMRTLKRIFSTVGLLCLVGVCMIALGTGICDYGIDIIGGVDIPLDADERRDVYRKIRGRFGGEITDFRQMKDGTAKIGSQDITTEHNTTTNYWNPEARWVVSGDFNGDGCTDLILQQRGTEHYMNTYLLASYAVAEFCEFEKIKHPITTINSMSGYHWTTEARQLVVGDFNGDGMDDLVLQQNGFGTVGDEHNTFLLIATGNTNDPNNPPFEAPEIITYLKPAEGDVSEMNGNYWKREARELIPGDFNGDGCEDLILRQEVNNRYSNTYLLISKNNGGNSCSRFHKLLNISNAYGMNKSIWANSIDAHVVRNSAIHYRDDLHIHYGGNNGGYYLLTSKGDNTTYFNTKQNISLATDS